MTNQKNKKKTKKQSSKMGLPPGSVLFIGEVHSDEVQLLIMDYSKEQVEEFRDVEIEKLKSLKDSDTVSWINIHGIHDTKKLKSIGDIFGIHPLVLEDIVNTEHRPKFEDYGNYLFFTQRILKLDSQTLDIESNQVSFIMGLNYVISFQEKSVGIYDPLRKRIRDSMGKIRSKGADYLLYALIDIVVDNYYVASEEISQQIETLEEAIIVNPGVDISSQNQDLRRVLLNLRKSITPMREALLSMINSDNSLIQEVNIKYFNDVYDHSIHMLDSLDTYREINSSIRDMYLSGLSERANKVMQMLTLIATIFIPLTFIAGIYGMNFDHMPELHWKYGYFTMLGMMAIITFSLIIFFRKKKWL
ncbi:MAG: magnesium/cobalt transporter CorA [Bacteroidales bacterium]|nr:magnesium/cobalt transporter CorA [Bacteroidales bacterium]